MAVEKGREIFPSSSHTKSTLGLRFRCTPKTHLPSSQGSSSSFPRTFHFLLFAAAAGERGKEKEGEANDIEEIRPTCQNENCQRNSNPKLFSRSLVAKVQSICQLKSFVECQAGSREKDACLFDRRNLIPSGRPVPSSSSSSGKNQPNLLFLLFLSSFPRENRVSFPSSLPVFFSLFPFHITKVVVGERRRRLRCLGRAKKRASLPPLLFPTLFKSKINMLKSESRNVSMNSDGKVGKFLTTPSSLVCIGGSPSFELRSHRLLSLSPLHRKVSVLFPLTAEGGE